MDLLDGTPVLDIKPYAPEFDIREADKTGWLEETPRDPATLKDDGRFTG